MRDLKRAGRVVKRFLQIGWLLACAWFALARVDIALRARGFQRTLERAEQPGWRSADAEALRRARRYARGIELASRYHVVPARCLHCSLVLHRWLHAEGLPSDLKIGVRKDPSGLKAHAWVELGGHVVGDRPSSVAAFRPLAGPVEGGLVWSGAAPLALSTDLGRLDAIRES